jgi:hypothetical protein
MEEIIEKKKLISISDLFSKSLEIYKKNFKAIIILMLVPFAITIAEYFSKKIEMGIFSFIIALLSLVSIIIPFAFLMYLENKETMGLKEAVIKVLKKSLIPLFLLNILVGIITTGGFLLLIIPGIYMSVALFSAGYFLVLENNKIMDSLSKSWEYSKNNVAKIFWNFFVLGIVSIILSLFGSVFSVFGEAAGEIGVALVSSLFVGPLGLIYGYLIYKNLKEIKGDNLEIKSNNKTKLWLLFALGIIASAGLIFFIVTNLNSIPAEMLEF